MTIAKNPSPTPPAEKAKDAIAEAFIKASDRRAAAAPPPAGATATARGKPAAKTKKSPESVVQPPMKEKKGKDKTKDKDKEKGKGKEKKKAKKNKKEAVIIRFENAQLDGIDAAAEALGLSRAAWVRMIVSRALAKA
jgi:hypothetical protein